MTTEAIRTQQALIALLYAIKRVLHIIPPFMQADVLAACQQAEAVLKAEVSE